MPIISLSPEFLKLRSEKIEKIKERRKMIVNKKITLIFKKEYQITEKDFIRKLAEDLHILSSKNLYDEIYIVKDDKLIDEYSIKEIYSYIKNRERKNLAKIAKSLTNTINRLIKIIEIIKNK
ncbi:MAG: hypothetical protein QXQ19_01115 [Candidatus Aenigmatarchaeota archaeon]